MLVYSGGVLDLFWKPLWIRPFLDSELFWTGDCSGLEGDCSGLFWTGDCSGPHSRRKKAAIVVVVDGVVQVAVTVVQGSGYGMKPTKAGLQAALDSELCGTSDCSGLRTALHWKLLWAGNGSANNP